ncbi:GNAT family N-acetyltransferase [Shimia sp.]|uniref:GNAT family N-acetyltransferase n=1 Tax=Shimia sp. TaxID=1954381 RepID=UPI003298041A
MKYDATTTRDAALHVEVIDTWADFAALRPAWEQLYDTDPETSVFLSWQWIAQAFSGNTFRWSVLVVRAEAGAQQVMCILPLKYRVHWSRSRNEFHTEIEAGGRLLWSEYTGFLCHPSFEQQGLEAAATKLAQLPWTRLSMRYVAQERRARIFVDALEKNGAKGAFRDYMINKGTTNNLLCPQVGLPDDFETYLDEQVSANRRQKWRRFLRHRIEKEGVAFHLASDKDAETNIDQLLSNWMERWEDDKGTRTAKSVASNYRDVLMSAHKQGDLFLPSLRREGNVLGALGHVLDRDQGRVHFIVAGRDVNAKDPFIGAALHFHSIQWAIENGFTCYDFCHGNEDYKYSFGAEDQEVFYFVIRRQAYNPHLAFDSIGTGEALGKIEGFIQDGNTERATLACRQLANLLS